VIDCPYFLLYSFSHHKRATLTKRVELATRELARERGREGEGEGERDGETNSTNSVMSLVLTITKFRDQQYISWEASMTDFSRPGLRLSQQC